MNHTDVILQEPRRKDIDRCNCPQCKGALGTARVCFNSRKLAARAAGSVPTKTVGLLLLLVCFFLQGQVSADVVNPTMKSTTSGKNDPTSVGYLKVFSSTEQAQWGEGSYYYLHTGYRIYDCNGKVVKWVANHESSTEENPTKVELAPGAYVVWAQSDKNGYVKVPVLVKLAQVTAVHLET